jgi:hypothetical protein
MRHALAGPPNMSLSPAATFGHGLLGSSGMVGVGGNPWSGLNSLASNQASTSQAIAAFLEQQQAQQAANNQLMLQHLQQQQILEELERQRHESGT